MCFVSPSFLTKVYFLLQQVQLLSCWEKPQRFFLYTSRILQSMLISSSYLAVQFCLHSWHNSAAEFILIDTNGVYIEISQYGIYSFTIPASIILLWWHLRFPSFHSLQVSNIASQILSTLWVGSSLQQVVDVLRFFKLRIPWILHGTFSQACHEMILSDIRYDLMFVSQSTTT